MRLSFDDEESFKESLGDLRFNKPSSDDQADQDSLQQVGSSMPHQERNEAPSDPDVILQVRRVGSSSSTSSMSPKEKDI